VTVFYDENGNGQLDASEPARVPLVDVVVGGASGRAAAGTGLATVTGVPAGTHTVGLRTETLPAYYVAGPAPSLSVPATASVAYPVTLPIGGNEPYVYLGYGDSITDGVGSSDARGYTLRLQNRLGPHFGRAEVLEWGRSATMSREGATRTTVTLRWFNPSWVLIHYGTNDWQDQTCQNNGVDACFTIDALREIVDDIRAFQSLPVLATLIPVNPALAPAGRNQWIDETNARIRDLARAEGVLLADLNAAFRAEGSLQSLYVDDIHPNDAGYDVMARGWFAALSSGRAAAGAARRRFGFSVPGF
jgi:lysophospholipase L1-like esterase